MRPTSYACRVLLSSVLASVLLGRPASAQESGAALDGPRRVTEASSQHATPASPDRSTNADDSSEATDVSDRPARRVGVEVMLGTTAPLDVGVSARLVLFERLYVYGGLGVGVYGGVYDAVASG